LEEEAEELHRLLARYFEATYSARAQWLLQRRQAWPELLWAVRPKVAETAKAPVPAVRRRAG
jgi:glutamate synthase domain-containing protein 3